MYDYREYLTLSEAAEMLGTDVRALLEQNSLETNKYGIPKIGFESDQLGTIYRFDLFTLSVFDYSEKDCADSLSAFLYGVKPNDVTIKSDGDFYYLSYETINKIRRKNFVDVGGYSEQSDFNEKINSFIENSIFIEIPDSDSNESRFYRNKRLKGMFSSTPPSYVCPNKVTLTVEDLLIRRSDIEKVLTSQRSIENQLFYANAEIRRLESILNAERASRNFLDEDSKIKLIEQLRVNLDEANNEVFSLKEVVELKDQKISKAYALFDERMQEVFKPYINIIIDFGSSTLYEKYKIDKSKVTLKAIKEWIKNTHADYKDERSAEFIKDMINLYYKIKL